MPETTTLDWPTEVTPILHAAQALLVGNKPDWLPCSARMADYFLEVLPPIYFKGGFACSEESSYVPGRGDVYLAFRYVDYKRDTAETRYLSRAEMKAAA